MSGIWLRGRPRPTRLRLFEAQKRWPDIVFSPLGGAVCHAIDSRYAPTLLCLAKCGHLGYAPSLEFELEANAPTCMRCTRALGAA